MPRRILVAEDTGAVPDALRRALEAAGILVDVVPPSALPAGLDPAAHVAAVVRGGEDAERLVRALRAADPHVPVLAFFPDAAEADAFPAASGADGLLVGPLGVAAVAGACRTAERLRELSRRAAAAEAPRLPVERDLEFLKRLMLVEVKRSRRYGYPLALALLALDGWKEQFERLPARQRTALLADVLGVLHAAVRDIDVAVPFADDRFVVLMPHTKAESALRVARRLCARIRERRGPVTLTASAGVAGHDGDRAVSFGGLVKRAAAALTRAREEGGDRALPAEPPRRRDRISMG